MVVRHNLPAMNSNRQLGINNSSTAKNLEKLSSGFRINRAGDDAAGLAISEKMRGQIRGLDMANQNAENGISLIQTAEGALNETHSVLQRIRELAVQSANGTYHDKVDRENLDKEVQALKSEVDRISSSTHYNGINLLDGSLGGKKLGSSATANIEVYKEVFGGGYNLYDIGISLNSNLLNSMNLKEGDIVTANLVVRDIIEVSGANYTKNAHYSLQIGDKTYTCRFDRDNTGSYSGDENYFRDENGNEVGRIGGLIFGASGFFQYDDRTGVVNNIELKVSTLGSSLTASIGLASENMEGAIIASPKSRLMFQIGANGTFDQKVGLHVDNMSSGNLGDRIISDYNISGTVANINISSIDSANDAIRVINAAINQVSGTRADLGALQNRLEHTINNLGVARENLQNAESSIRDVDMAKEMMDFTKNNILAQASQSMLAQANQMPQGIIQLLAA